MHKKMTTRVGLKGRISYAAKAQTGEQALGGTAGMFLLAWPHVDSECVTKSQTQKEDTKDTSAVST